MNDPVYVFGSNGFIGSHVLRGSLSSSMIGVTRKECDLLDADQCSAFVKSIPHKKFSVVFCSAIGRSIEDTLNSCEKNIRMLINLLIAFQEQNSNIIDFTFLSSIDVYGDSPKLPLIESHPTSPNTFYGVSKLSCELLLKTHFAKKDTKVQILRLPGIFSKTDTRGQSIINKFVDKISNNDDIVLFGDGNIKRDFVFADDLVEIIRLAQQVNQSYFILNVATGTAISLLDIINTLEQSLGKKASIIYKDIKDRSYDLKFNTKHLTSNFPDHQWTPISKIFNNA